MNIKRETLDGLSIALKLEEEFNETLKTLDKIDITKSSFDLNHGERLVFVFKDSDGRDLSIAVSNESIRRGGKHGVKNLLSDEVKVFIVESLKEALIKHSSSLVKEGKKKFKEELLGDD